MEPFKFLIAHLYYLIPRLLYFSFFSYLALFSRFNIPTFELLYYQVLPLFVTVYCSCGLYYLKNKRRVIRLFRRLHLALFRFFFAETN